jgi:site-specific DNA-methyltransferase (adenine-specific)
LNPYYSQHNIIIYHGDCRDILPTLEPVDLIVTDPAYRGIGGGKPSPQGPTGILASNDGRLFEHNDIDTHDYAALFYAVLKDPAHCYVMINNKNLESALTDFRLAGFHFHNLLAWDKITATPNNWYMKNFEPILFFRKGPAFPINNPSAKATLYHPNPRNKLHPTEKPETLMREMIQNSSRAGEVVLDPFMGSGATLEAAYKSNRQAIGTEIDEKYCRVAAERLDKLLHRPVYQLSLESVLEAA